MPRPRFAATASGRWTSHKFETTFGGTWRICCVVDYATKYVLAAHISATAKARDAVNALRSAVTRAEELLLHDLAGDCVDLETAS